MKLDPAIQLRIEEFCTRLEDLHRDYHGSTNHLFEARFIPQYGPKRAKIVKKEKSERSGSVYCFIDLLNGDILKAATWQAPAAGKRGSIWNDDCDVGPAKPANMFGSGLYKR